MLILILDAASMAEAINQAKTLNPEFLCLYKGNSAQEQEATAPYLFSYKEDDGFGNFIKYKGWGNSCGVFVNSNSNLEELQTHFRKFLIVDTYLKKHIYFRFYDPRVLRIFLPTCDTQQLKEFFGPVQEFVMEDEDPAQAVTFSLKKLHNILFRRRCCNTLSNEKIYR